MNESNFIMQPAPRLGRHANVFTHPDTIIMFEKLEVQLRLMGYTCDQAKTAIDDWVLACQVSLQHPREQADAFLRKMTEQSFAEGKLTKEEKRRIEVERADKVLSRSATLDDVVVYVPVANAGPFGQKAIRLTRENRHALLADKLKRKGKK